MSDQSPKKNRLASETSPYLLQHDTNPVDWYPWGEEAFAAADASNKPILLSIGYAACHWCHVMAHESFEDKTVAAIMNEHFVNIKVDREERPDIDRIYMDALHMMGEQGGWPLTIFLTPDRKPFWGGTYFPPESQYGRPSFTHILTELSRIWHTEHDKIETNSKAILQRMSTQANRSSDIEPTEELLIQTVKKLVNAIDPENGGMGQAPKFPQSPIFQLLWSAHQSYPDEQFAKAVWLTMSKISQGGIYDHLAGGIARYAVDNKWLVPHFEKMLYDNAQFVSLLCAMQNQAPNNLFRNRIKDTVKWLLQDMKTRDGLFASSYDADSEGIEGKYYCWQKSEINMALEESNRHLFCKMYDVSESGNWEHTNILNRTAHPYDLSENDEFILSKARRKLLEVRKERTPPGWDDKALTDWNALTVIALLDSSNTLTDPELQKVALATLSNIQTHLRRDGKLHHSFRKGSVRSHATLDDYAHLIAASIAAYETTFDVSWLADSRHLVEEVTAQYLDTEHGGFFMAPHHATDLIVRDKYATDDVTPNANATMVINLWKLSHYLNNEEYLRTAKQVFDWLTPYMINNPFSCPTGWLAFMALNEQPQLILVGDANDERFKDLHLASLKISIPNRTIFHLNEKMGLPENHPAKQKQNIDQPAVYLCRNHTCGLPITNPDELAKSGIH